jgi:hypothetical protein
VYSCLNHYRSFQENEEGTGYFLFVGDKEMHYALVKPFTPYRHNMCDIETKLDSMFWVEKQVTSGKYGYQQPRGNELLMMDFIYENDDNVENARRDRKFILAKVFYYFLSLYFVLVCGSIIFIVQFCYLTFNSSIYLS